MSKLQALSNGLESVYEQKRTGKLSVVGKQGKSVKVGTIMVRRGEIVSVKYRDQSDHEALKFLLSIEIVQAIFFPAPVPGSENTQDLPSTSSLLQQIGNDAPQIPGGNAIVAQEIDLKGEALKLLEELFGAAASQKIDKIAAKYPPTEQPIAFLSSCKRIIEPVFGPAVAEQTLDSLYRKLNKDELR